MRSSFALILCFVCLSGCADVRDHWAYGFESLWRHNCGQVVKHGPEVAGAVAAGAVDGAADSAIYGHESPREWQDRSNAEFFGH